MVSIALMFLFAVASTMIDSDVLNKAQWFQFISTTMYFTVLILMTLVSTSYLNVEMEMQIKRLSRIREVYQRIVQDEEMLRANPVSIDS